MQEADDEVHLLDALIQGRAPLLLAVVCAEISSRVGLWIFVCFTCVFEGAAALGRGACEPGRQLAACESVSAAPFQLHKICHISNELEVIAVFIGVFGVYQPAVPATAAAASAAATAAAASSSRYEYVYMNTCVLIRVYEYVCMNTFVLIRVYEYVCVNTCI